MKTAGISGGLFILVILACFSNLANSTSCDSSIQANSSTLEAGSGSGWVQTWGTTVNQGSCDVKFIAEDPDGNIFTAGNYHRIIDFDPTDGEYICGYDGSGVSIYISKFDKQGNYLWTREFYGSLGYDMEGMVADSAGGIYITGSFDDTSDFDPGKGEAIRFATNNSSQNYLLKLNSDGEYQWVKTWLGTRPGTMAIGLNDHVYVSGYLVSQSVERYDEGVANGWYSEVDIDTPEADTTYILGFDSDGNIVDHLSWEYSLDHSISIESITVSLDGILYVAGSFKGNVNLAPNDGENPAVSQGGKDAFITAISNDRTTMWAKSWGSPMAESVWSVVLNSVGDIFIGGGFDSSVDFDPGDDEFTMASDGATDCYINHLDSNGNFINAVSWGGLEFEMGSGLIADREDNILVWGRFSSKVDFDPGDLENTRENVGFSDGFLVKYDPDLNFRWVNTLEMGTINSVIIDSANHIFVGGEYSGVVDFDPGEGVDERNVFHYLADTSFLWKLLPNGGWTSDYIPQISIEPVETEMSTEPSLGPEEFQNVVVVKTANLESATQPVNLPVAENPDSGSLFSGGWADTYGNDREDIIEGLGVDSFGNAYILAGQGGGAYTSGHDPTLRKYSPDGNLEWVRSNYDTPSSCLFTDDNGDCYVGGSRYTRTIQTGSAYSAATVTKYTIDGDIDRIITIGKAGKSSIDAIYVTDSGEIYMSGYFAVTEDFDIGDDVHELTPASGMSAFVAMYSHDFKLMWAATWAGRYRVSGTSLQVDDSGGVYVSGHMIADIPARSTETYTPTDFDSVNSFVRKFTWDGDPEWAYVFDNPSKCYLPEMTMDNEGSTYLCGFFSGNLDADPGSGVFELNANEEDGLIIKIDSGGNFQFAKTITGEYIQEVRWIAVSPDNRLVYTGDYQYEVDFDPGDGEFLMTPPGQALWDRSMDAYLCFLTLDGEFLDAFQLGGDGGTIRGTQVCVDADGNIIWAGIFTASDTQGTGLDFDPGEGEDFHTSPGMGLNDVFIVKYSPDLTW